MKISSKILLSAILSILALSLFAKTSDAAGSSKEILERADLEVYHGWIKYLEFDANVVAKRPDVTPSAAQEKRRRLKEWVEIILTNPNYIYEATGMHEWAYESPVDGTGQPFMLNIPVDYNPATPTPMTVIMHGLGGNHFEHFSGKTGVEGLFQISVLGRSRAGNYIALSGADVLHTIEYMKKYWNIDADRVHLAGGSMGGNGAFMLGAQFPHLFASARPGCGYASDKPIGNLLTLPIYATHSEDDFTVSILHSRGPLARLRELGGQVIYDQTDGYGHAVWNYSEGNKRSGQWFRTLARPASHDVRQINFTALDGNAARCWWAQVAEWGPKAQPATFKLTVGNSDVLYAELGNVGSLELDLANAPFAADKDLNIWINGATPLNFPAPLPEKAYLTKTQNGWAIGTQAPELESRFHTPGGPNQLYNGDPLLIVYGTSGTATEKAAMLEAAQAASHNSNACWAGAFGGAARDGMTLSHNLYGNLRFVPDTAVTAEDVKRCHLVLIGTASQNAIVARMQDRLPVKVGAEIISFSDGLHFPAKDNGIGLVHFNPEAPDRLIFWVASNDSRAYGADAYIPAYMSFPYVGYPAAPTTGVDCLVMKANAPTIVATRSFTSRWDWIRDEASNGLADATSDGVNFMDAVCESMRRSTYADFALSGYREQMNAPVYEAETAKAVDLERLFYWEPIGLMELDGETLLRAQETLAKKGQGFYPAPVAEEIDPYQTYRVAINQRQIWIFVMETRLSPNYEITDVTLSQAIDRHFPQRRVGAQGLTMNQPRNGR